MQSYIGRAQVAFPRAGVAVRGIRTEQTAFVCNYGEPASERTNGTFDAYRWPSAAVAAAVCCGYALTAKR